jgi:tetratricopeptide (TPR) repeat protein
MPNDLLERDELLARLDALLRQAAAGSGRMALVSGEAGIGKTSLIDAFTRTHATGARTLWGACEALFTPRPLGPLYDIAWQSTGPLRAALEQDSRAAMFASLLEELSSGTGAHILVFEDVHWADEATLDVTKFLGRRLVQLPVLFIITYRDDEVSATHPLRRVIGDIPSRVIARLPLAPLSPAAVSALAHRAGRSDARLHAATGGNPFFVTEVLASNTAGVPDSVHDAVLARVAPLSQQARRVADLAAVVPARVEMEIVDTLLGPDAPGLDECLAAGVLRTESGAVAFRHELARQAIEESLAPATRRTLHDQVLRALQAMSEEPLPFARLVHHAVGAGEEALALRYAPQAARAAATRGAHREAAAHYETALRYGASLAPPDRAELLEALSYEDYLIGRMEEAATACQQALVIWARLFDNHKVGRNVRRLSRLHWFLGNSAESYRLADEAIRLLETGPADSELAMAYSNRAQLAMQADDLPGARLWGGRAIELAERLDDQETLCHALNNVGAVEMNSGDTAGRSKLDRSLRIAQEHCFEEHVARGYNNIAEAAMMYRDYVTAKQYHAESLAYCVDHDLDTWEVDMRGRQARQQLDLGEWDGAAVDATAVLRAPDVGASTRIPALLVLGLLRARRGDPDCWRLLDEARESALASGEQQRIAPMAAARGGCMAARRPGTVCPRSARGL